MSALWRITILKLRKSIVVKPPFLQGCLVWAECVVEEEIARDKYVLIVEKVVHLEVDDRFFSEAEGMDFERAKPLCIMGGRNRMQFTSPVATGYKSDYVHHPDRPG